MILALLSGHALFLGVLWWDANALVASATFAIALLFSALTALILVRRLAAYSATLVIFHTLMLFFIFYIYTVRENVVAERMFDYSVFTETNLKTAVTAVSASILAFGLVGLGISRKDRRSGMFLSLLRRVTMALGRTRPVYIAATAICALLLALVWLATSVTVFEAPYPLNRQAQSLPDVLAKMPSLAGAAALALAYSRALNPGVAKPVSLLWFSRVVFLLVMGISLVVEGARGLPTFLLATAGGAEVALALGRRRIPTLGAVFLFLSLIAFLSWPQLRSVLWNATPDQAVSIIVSSLSVTISDGSEVKINDYPMVGQSLFHLLYAIQLQAEGVGLNGATFTNLLPQSLPGVFDGVLWERPLNDNWLLMQHFWHGGGFLVVANAYWNGGLLVVVAFCVVLSWIVGALDRHATSATASIGFLVVYWFLLSIFIVQIAYGIQGLVRVLEVVAIAAALEKLNAPFFRRQRAREQGGAF